MATKTIGAGVQIGANNPMERVRADRNLLHYVQKKAIAGGGWSQRDTDLLVKSGVLNDKSPVPPDNTDEYGNVTEGAVIRPMYSKMHDMRTKVVLESDKFGAVEFQFTSAKSRDHFRSEMGRWFQANAS